MQEKELSSRFDGDSEAVEIYNDNTNKKLNITKQQMAQKLAANLKIQHSKQRNITNIYYNTSEDEQRKKTADKNKEAKLVLTSTQL